MEYLRVPQQSTSGSDSIFKAMDSNQGCLIESDPEVSAFYTGYTGHGLHAGYARCRVGHPCISGAMIPGHPRTPPDTPGHPRTPPTPPDTPGHPRTPLDGLDMATVTISLTPEERALLDQIADTQHRSKEDLASEALREYLKFEAEQVRKIEAGVAAADRGGSPARRRSRPSSPSMPVLDNAGAVDSSCARAPARDRRVHPARRSKRRQPRGTDHPPARRDACRASRGGKDRTRRRHARARYPATTVYRRLPSPRRCGGGSRRAAYFPPLARAVSAPRSWRIGGRPGASATLPNVEAWPRTAGFVPYVG